MNKKVKVKKIVISSLLVAALAVTSMIHEDFWMKKEVKADVTAGSDTGIRIETELAAKRSQFTKQFAMSDGSFNAVTYSMPVHYKKSGQWKEIDTTLKKSGKKNYKTKSTALTIKVSKKANRKSVISLKRGRNRLSVALKGKKLKASKVKISNPKKTAETDVMNQNTVTYKKVLKNTNISYDIFPEKIQEIVSVTKKQKRKSLSYKINSGKLKVKVKGKKVYFKTKKGKTKYTRLSTVITDAKGVSTTKVKLSYNKKKKVLKVTPDKKWWNSKKRKFPVQVRTTYITDKHSRDVQVGAAYAGAPNSNFSYDKSLLLKANKSVAFTKMTNLAELSQPNVLIRDAALHIKSEKTLKLGAGKTFDIGVHKVTQNWNAKKLTYNNRPSYDANASATFGIQKKGSYQCDVTDIVKAWYAGEGNYGVALVADNSNRSYQAKLDRNPYYTVHYEVVGFEGAVELKEDQDITRDVLASGQENYYYFDPKPGIAYELYTTSTLDTQGILYNSGKERLAYDDNSGLNENFQFISSYDGRRYLKVNTKGTATGKYTLSLKKRFAIPEPVGKAGQDSYIISWDAIKNAKEYLVTIYDEKGMINEVLVKGTSYEYVYTNETAGKTLAFTVTPRETEECKGEASRRIYNTDAVSEWSYDTPMHQTRTMFGSTVCNGKIYVLGGMTEGKKSSRTMEVFDTDKQTWTKLSDYPGAVEGICNMAFVAVGKDIYVLGGQTDDTANARLLSDVYCYHTENGKWEKKASLPQKRTGMAVTVCDGKIYAFARIGTTERVDIYDVTEDTWTSNVKADTSINVQAQTIDGHIYVLREKNIKDAVKAEIYWEEYLPDKDEYDNESSICPINHADRYTYGTAVDGKIYMVKENETNEVVCYDAYLDTWSTISVMNLTKKMTELVSVGTNLYSIGGMNAFGYLDVVERYELETPQITKQIQVSKDEIYELQVEAGQLKEDTDYVITVRIDPEVLAFEKTSSFMSREKFTEGRDGVQLLKYAEKRGVLIFKLNDRMETGDTKEACQSIPVKGLVNDRTTVKMQIEQKG